jgi:predicted ArsR family transcriptional regulator
MTPVKPSIRHRYLAFFRKNQTASVEDLVRAMDVTPANVRHHLAGLQSDGLVTMVETRHIQKRGRPVKIYRLSRLAQGDNLTQLADALLSEWLAALDEGQLNEALGEVADRMVENVSSTSGHISRKLGFAVEQFNKMHYQARWEAHGSGPRVIFESCPYASVISAHPELCRLDSKILHNLLGCEVEQLATSEKGSRNIPVCVFAILERT